MKKVKVFVVGSLILGVVLIVVFRSCRQYLGERDPIIKNLRHVLAGTDLTMELNIFRESPHIQGIQGGPLPDYIVQKVKPELLHRVKAPFSGLDGYSLDFCYAKLVIRSENGEAAINIHYEDMSPDPGSSSRYRYDVARLLELLKQKRTARSLD